MGLCLLINIPFFINVFLKIIRPFVDPATREKIKLNPQVVEDGLVAREQLIKEGWVAILTLSMSMNNFSLPLSRCHVKEKNTGWQSGKNWVPLLGPRNGTTRGTDLY